MYGRRLLRSLVSCWRVLVSCRLVCVMRPLVSRHALHPLMCCRRMMHSLVPWSRVVAPYATL